MLYNKAEQQIWIIARRTTALIARDFEFQLQMLGYNAYVMSDSQIMKISKKLFQKKRSCYDIYRKKHHP